MTTAEGLQLLLVALSAALVSLLSATVERSGPVRLRSWAEETGGRLARLFAHPARFDAFRTLLSLAAKALAALLAVLLYLLFARSEMYPAAPWSVATVALLLALSEAGNRSLVRRAPEGSLRRLTPFYLFAYLLSAPLLPLLALPLSGTGGERREDDEEDEASEGELEAYLDFGAQEGILEPGEEELVRGVVDFGDTQVKSVMTPRIAVAAAPLEADAERLREMFLESGHSRLPVYEGSVDRVAGIFHIRDLLRSLGPEAVPVRELLNPPLFVPETKPLSELLKEMQASHQQMAIVVDEYGGTSGLVTVEDLIEEIVGEISDEHEAEESEIERLPDGSWRLEGRVHVEDLEAALEIELGEVSAETVGGLIFTALGYVPQAGETVERAGLAMRVESLEDRRIRTVRIERLADDEKGEAA